MSPVELSYEVLLCTLLPVLALVAVVLRLCVTLPSAARLALPLLLMLPCAPLAEKPLVCWAEPSAERTVTPWRPATPPLAPCTTAPLAVTALPAASVALTRPRRRLPCAPWRLTTVLAVVPPWAFGRTTWRRPSAWAEPLAQARVTSSEASTAAGAAADLREVVRVGMVKLLWAKWMAKGEPETASTLRGSSRVRRRQPLCRCPVTSR